MSLKPQIAAVAGLFLSALLNGCAGMAKPEAMTATPAVAGHRSAADISVDVSQTGSSRISNDGYAEALRDSISKSGLFASVSPTGARYRLSAIIGDVDQPNAGLSFTVRMAVTYALIDNQAHKTLWAQTISSQHSAGFGDAFSADKRLRVADEGAAKANIEQALRQIAALNLL
jgi:hypothetical protein